MKKLLLLLALLPLMGLSQINMIGYHASKIPDLMKEKDMKLTSTEKTKDGSTIMIYEDNKMPVSLFLYFEPKYNMCIGTTIAILKKDKSYMDPFVNWANENLEKQGSKWLEKKDNNIFEWESMEKQEFNLIVIKQKK